MPVVLPILGVIALVGAWALSRSPRAAQGLAAPQTPQQAQQQAQQGPAPSTQSAVPSTSANAPEAPKVGGGGGDAGTAAAGAIVAAAGVLGGAIAGASADTQEAKAIAVPVGVGIAALVWLGNIGGVAAASGVAALGAAGAICVPVVALTIAIVTVVDQVAKAVHRDEWKKLVPKVRALVESGDFGGATRVWRDGVAGIPEDVRDWPADRNDPLWNQADELGRPWPGFPGPPKASLADVRRWPAMIPDAVMTVDGKQLVVRQLLDAVYKDVADVRAWGLANGVVGRTVGPDGRAQDATTGPRSLRAWDVLAKKRDFADAWAYQLESAVPWLPPGALVRDSGAREENDIENEIAAQQKAAIARAQAAALEAAGLNVVVSSTVPKRAPPRPQQVDEDGQPIEAPAAPAPVVLTPPVAATVVRLIQAGTKPAEAVQVAVESQVSAAAAKAEAVADKIAVRRAPGRGGGDL